MECGLTADDYGEVGLRKASLGLLPPTHFYSHF
jgi:hypothetical protein